MDHFIVSILLTSVLFGFGVLDPKCDPDQLRVNSVFLFNTTISGHRLLYFVNDTIVYTTGDVIIANKINDLFKGDSIDTPLDLAYMNGTDIIEMIRLNKLTQTYSKWRYDLRKQQIVSKQSLSPLMRRIFTTTTIAVMDVNDTHATVVSNRGYVTVYTVDLMSGNTSDHLELLFKDDLIKLSKSDVSWDRVSAIHKLEISAAYRIAHNTYHFVANKYLLTVEVDKPVIMVNVIKNNWLDGYNCHIDVLNTTANNGTDPIPPWLPPQPPNYPTPIPTPTPLTTRQTPATTEPPVSEAMAIFYTIFGFMIILIVCVCLPFICAAIICWLLLKQFTRQSYAMQQHMRVNPQVSTTTPPDVVTGSDGKKSGNNKEKAIDSLSVRSDTTI